MYRYFASQPTYPKWVTNPRVRLQTDESVVDEEGRGGGGGGCVKRELKLDGRPAIKNNTTKTPSCSTTKVNQSTVAQSIYGRSAQSIEFIMTTPTLFTFTSSSSSSFWTFFKGLNQAKEFFKPYYTLYRYCRTIVPWPVCNRLPCENCASTTVCKYFVPDVRMYFKIICCTFFMTLHAHNLFVRMYKYVGHQTAIFILMVLWLL